MSSESQKIRFHNSRLFIETLLVITTIVFIRKPRNRYTFDEKNCTNCIKDCVPLLTVWPDPLNRCPLGSPVPPWSLGLAAYPPELPPSLLLLLKGLHLLLQPPESEDGDRSKEKDSDDGRVEDGWLDERKPVAGPVVEVGGVGQGGNPEHQEDQGGGVEDQPGDGDRHHLHVIVLSISQGTLGEDGGVCQTIEQGAACTLICTTKISLFKGYNEGDDDPKSKVDDSVLLEQGADDGDAADLEGEAEDEGGGELDHDEQLSAKALVLQYGVVIGSAVIHYF